MRSAQEVFETVARHLFTQGEQAMVRERSGYSYCRYRAESRDGRQLSCAVGCLIPDELYSPLIENQSVTSIVNTTEDCNDVTEDPEGIEAVLRVKTGVPEIKEHRALLTGLQDAHDDEKNWQDTSTMQIALIKVAADYELDAAFVQSLSFPKGC